MCSKEGDLYHQLFLAYKGSHADLPAQLCQKNANAIWKTAKETLKNKEKFIEHINDAIRELNVKATKKKATMLSYFTQDSDVATCSSFMKSVDAVAGQERTAVKRKMSDTHDEQSWNTIEETAETTSTEPHTILIDSGITKNVPGKPAQETLVKKIGLLQQRINVLTEARDIGIAKDDVHDEIKKLRNELKEEEKRLKKKRDSAKRAKKFRAKEKLEKIERQRNTPAATQTRTGPGQPPLVDSQPALLETIINIAIHGSAADERRRTEMIRSCLTLSDLHERLLLMGYQISRSGTYLHLLPRVSNTQEGRRHVHTVPVKLARPQTEMHRKHEDGEFCTATIRSLESLASLLGPQQVFVLSQDDKARVPIGLPAVKSQSPLLMHMEYRILLPDHDWVVAERHKLIPSVYAGVNVEPNSFGKEEAVGYSGPTHISIRSGKHASSTANTHAYDFQSLLSIPSFKPLMMTESNTVKPVIIIFVDGGPDENPRYRKVKNFAIEHFKKYNLDALFIATNAPGRSAFNRVERRMAPLSKRLAGIILPHEHFGSHLDDKGMTTDDDLEKRNFQHAGETLAEVWREMKIDNYDVSANYRQPEDSMQDPAEPNLAWYSVHVRESQYFLQVIKCADESCCSPPRSALKSVLADTFMPPPCPILQTPSKLVVPSLLDKGTSKFSPLLVRLSVDLLPPLEGFKQMPYDFFCPSVQSDLKKKVCPTCGIYFTSHKSVQMHCRFVHGKTVPDHCETRVRPQRLAARRANEFLCIVRRYETSSEDADWLDEDEVDASGLTIPEPSSSALQIPVMKESEWLANPWTEEQ
ncbi:unnamed protein product [Danaus chrysippus]|uniref:(African queen) hypothetical protein n=1 Tax=Danaus chrysippus TaxID=151541 RepID=A0A8J2WDZ9_9NEOP|nr:unnamed protein product [Danaus chrysippus]